MKTDKTFLMCFFLFLFSTALISNAQPKNMIKKKMGKAVDKMRMKERIEKFKEENPEVVKKLQKMKELEIKEQELGRKYKRASESEKKEIEKELKEVLNELFDLRTEGKEIKAKELEKRIKEWEDKLKEIKSDIEDRKKNKNTIIQKRFEDLIKKDKALEW